MSTDKYQPVAEAMFVAVRAWFRGEIAKTLGPLEERVAAAQTIKGDPGEAGPQGPQGDSGQNGADGPQGAAGSDGAVGPQGEKGADGLIGKDGATGARGDIGPQGDRGAAGLSAFEIAKAGGFVGSEVDWLLTIRGKDGQRGGDGQNGQDGRDGRNGEPGRDAFELDIVDGIDETRSYPARTVASFNGGTWRAQRSTDPVRDGQYRDAGWVCIMRGQVGVSEDLEDGGRFVIRTTTFSDGTEQAIRLKTTTMIYRGVFESGREYDAGDAVTYGGSVFAAQGTTKQAPGSDPAMWKLAVKRGKDGREPS